MVSLRKTMCCVFLSGAFCVSACGGDDGGSDGADENTAGTASETSGSTNSGGSTGDAVIEFNASPIYSAYDGQNPYRVPVWLTTPLDGVEWSAEPASAVDIEPAEELGEGVQLITVKAAGTVKITAALGDTIGTLDLIVTEATPEQWQTGNARYNNDQMLPDFESIDFEEYQLPDGGMRELTEEEQMWVDDLMNTNDWACVNCHNEEAELFGKEHTPMQTSGYSDEELIQIVTMGMKPADAEFISPIGAIIFPATHTWDAGMEERMGLVVYLRSLEPKNQGEIKIPELDIDPSQFGGFGGAGSGSGTGTDTGTETEDMTGGEAEAETEAEAGAETEAGTEAEAGAEAEAEAGTEAEAGAEVEVDAEATVDVEAGAETGTEADMAAATP